MQHLFKPAGITHITLRVNDIALSEKFYSEVLGFPVEKKMGQGMTVYRVGSDTLVISEAETGYDQASRDYRVDHFGFEVQEPEKIDEIAAWLKKHETTIISGPANRKTGRFLFCTDPDGNLIEFYCDKAG
jgi:catechol-2,3-dioxygenase